MVASLWLLLDLARWTEMKACTSEENARPWLPPFTGLLSERSVAPASRRPREPGKAQRRGQHSGGRWNLPFDGAAGHHPPQPSAPWGALRPPGRPPAECGERGGGAEAPEGGGTWGRLLTIAVGAHTAGAGGGVRGGGAGPGAALGGGAGGRRAPLPPSLASLPMGGSGYPHRPPLPLGASPLRAVRGELRARVLAPAPVPRRGEEHS